jgi:hypothetical protein
MSYIYLASPYSDPSRAIRHFRYSQAMLAVANLYKRQVTVYSPIVHNHVIAKDFTMPTEAGFWEWHNHTMMERAIGMYILDIDGWLHSKGIREEVEFARGDELPIQMVNIEGEPRAYVEPALWELD